MWLAGDWQEQFEFGWQLILGVEPVGEVDSSNSTIRMNLHPERLYVVGTVGSASEIRQVELNLVPALVQSHGHCAYEWLDPCG